MRKTWRLWGACLLFAGVVGCGGGDGGGGGDGDDSGSNLDTTTASELEIDDSNGDTAGEVAVGGSQGVADTAVGTTESQFINAADVDGQGSELSVAEVTNVALRKLDQLAEQEPFAVSGIKTSQDCPDGGSATISEKNGGTGTKDQLDTGDKWTAEWNSCESSASGATTTIDGKISFEVVDCDSCDGDVGDASQEWNYKIDITYTDWTFTVTQSGVTSTDLVIDGGFDLRANNKPGGSSDKITYTATGGPWEFRDRVSGSGFGFGNLDLEQVENRDNGTFTLTIRSMEFIGTGLGGKISVTTPTALSGDSGSVPTSGTLKIEGANSTTAEVRAGKCSDSKYELVVNGADKGCQSWS